MACSRRWRVVVCAEAKKKVVVTGAAGQTGNLLLKKLVARQEFVASAVIRGEKSKSKVASAGVADSQVFIADIGGQSAASLGAAFDGADALVIATSAIPKIRPLSILKVLWAKLTKQEGVRPDFDWKEGQWPEQVDWVGQKLQIDEAKRAGVRHVVLISSMGGTDPENPLNKLGDGNILQWKRRAEQYLLASGLAYTIIHPGGLVDEKGGERQIILGVDDELLKRKVRSIPREDVAELCVQALLLPEAQNRSIDAICLPKGEGTPVTDFAALYSAMSQNCDYTINSQLPEAVTATA